VKPDPADLSVGDSGPKIVMNDLEREDFVRYVGASGDFNPLHYDEPYAESAGYPSVVGQGMLTASIASRVVARWLGVGTIDRFAVRFQAPIWPGDTIVATGEVIDKYHSDDGVHLDLEVRVKNQNEEVLLTGEAHARVP
jgi:acyl dehydratase